MTKTCEKPYVRVNPAIQAQRFAEAVALAADLPAEEHLLEEAIAARWLHLGVQGFTKLRKEGRGPKHCKIGNRILYRRSDLLKWIEGRVRAA